MTDGPGTHQLRAPQGCGVERMGGCLGASGTEVGAGIHRMGSAALDQACGCPCEQAQGTQDCMWWAPRQRAGAGEPGHPTTHLDPTPSPAGDPHTCLSASISSSVKWSCAGTALGSSEQCLAHGQIPEVLPSPLAG